MIIDYCVIASKRLADLELRVKEMCNREWEPQGGVSVIQAKRAPDGDVTRDFYQAMILMKGFDVPK